MIRVSEEFKSKVGPIVTQILIFITLITLITLINLQKL